VTVEGGLDAVRDPARVHSLAHRLARQVRGRPLNLMHVCGTHENAITRHGLRGLLPAGVRVIAGPGCPVCVCPPEDIQTAAELALRPGVTVATFGDMVRVPGELSLEEARARGGDVRIVMGAAGAVRLARDDPDREVVLFAVGFETTACTVAAAALADPPPNLSLLVSHRRIPPALAGLLALPDVALDGFLLPGHVLTVTGLAAYDGLARRAGIPAVVAGFEPGDVMLGLVHLARLAGRGETFNAYPRAVRPGGNPAALRALDAAFVHEDARWRGVGSFPASGYRLRPELAALDARIRFGLPADRELPDHSAGCRCGEVMVGRLEPEDCPLFDRGCSPATPRGPCMVSAEGTCRNRHQFQGVDRD
jgi:hydrogenase expression/formation protein HypD